MMMFLLLHVMGYVATAGAAFRGARAAVRRHKRRSRKAFVLRVTRLEQELGLGIDWALDDLENFAPVLSRPLEPGYHTLHEYAFRCYGCEKNVVYGNYEGRPKNDVRDKRRLLCNSCLPERLAA